MNKLLFLILLACLCAACGASSNPAPVAEPTATAAPTTYPYVNEVRNNSRQGIMYVIVSDPAQPTATPAEISVVISNDPPTQYYWHGCYSVINPAGTQPWTNANMPTPPMLSYGYTFSLYGLVDGRDVQVAALPISIDLAPGPDFAMYTIYSADIAPCGGE